MAKPKKEFDWFDRPSSRRLLWWLLWISCAATLGAELLVHRHAYFGIDGWFGFYGMLGLGGCAVMILAANAWGLVVKRDENYWDEDGEDDAPPEDIDDAQSH